ncbi:3-oxoacyl-[acyl-carrier-protein] reductase [Suicoccus acidiformans]|uniref:3-oxoacyl-[acyl-carrier-protein] reductase n=1 Tax=Suicoccus acidiformans TaxID=2036206 RepID=A0A347WJE3_9LACT|nr:3-oxoacyl-[acyl-carrier-protein] reductase [Suicoccus acidiformans]AXY25200.1 3-oxoacyl-[acyl-carrier-protein] reductase [Suicoccus acidiformans]
MTKICLVTGSSRGIGLAIAKHLASLGHQVILNSRKPLSDEVIAQFEGYAYPAASVVGDVSDFTSAQAMVQEVVDRFGKIDVLVNNAGLNRDGLFVRMSEEDYDTVLDVNLKGTFNMTRHVAPHMVKQREGAIINMSSIVGVMGNAGQANYAASKAGIIGLTKSLARELGGRSVTVNAIAPGFIETDMTDELSEKVKKAMLAQIPMKRFGQVEEVAHCVEFLMENKYITGQTIEINGGMHT